MYLSEMDIEFFVFSVVVTSRDVSRRQLERVEKDEKEEWTVTPQT